MVMERGDGYLGGVRGGGEGGARRSRVIVMLLLRGGGERRGVGQGLCEIFTIPTAKFFL